MKKLCLVLAAGAAIAVAFPAAAQIAVDTPVGGVRIGEPRHDYHTHYGYRAPGNDDTVVERRVYRERQVRGPGCRTVTIRESDGSMKRIHRCTNA